MSDRMTTVGLPGPHGQGLMLPGRVDASSAIERVRAAARQEVDRWQQVLDADDADFEVYTHLGVHMQKKREYLQHSRLEERP